MTFDIDHQQNEARRILISGAGVAGLALAHWLRQYGFAPTLVERSPALRTGGQAIDIRGAAREVIERMGLLPGVRGQHTQVHGLAYLDRFGRRVGEMSADTFGDSGGVVAEIEIVRGDLLRLLHQKVDDVECRYDDSITSLDEDATGVDVTFERSPARRFDLVVGADGLRSNVRSLTFDPDAVQVRDLGHYTSYFPARTELVTDGWELMYNLPAGNGVGGRAVLLYPIRNTGEVRVMLSFASPELPYDRHDVQAQKDLLARAFAGAGWQFPDLLKQLADTDDLYFARVGEVRVRSWSKGRVALLGDSAFGGSLGMGTSMALVGAYVLAGELAAAQGDHRTALAGYENRLRDFVRLNQKRPPGSTSGFLPRTRRGIWLRNQVVRALPHLPGGAKMMGGMQESANAVTLPEYAI